MATKIFPSVNDVNGGVAGQGKTLTEANLKTLQSMPYFDRPYVKSGAVCTNGGGLNLNVATGHYCIDGRWVYKDATEVVALTASQTNRVWLQLTKDGSGNVTGTTWNVQTGTSVPSDAVLVAEVVTGASTITTITSSFRGIIAPGKLIATVASSSGSAGNSDRLSQAMMGDGVTGVSATATLHLFSTGTATVTTQLRDGAGGTGAIHDAEIKEGISPTTNTYKHNATAIAAWVGAKTFYTWASASAGTLNSNDGSGTSARRLTLRWDF